MDMSRFKNESQIDRFRRSLGLPIPGEENVESEFEVQAESTPEHQEEETPEKAPAQKTEKKKKAEPEPSPRTAVSLSRQFVSKLWSYHYYLVHRKDIPVRSMEALLSRLLERELSKDPEARKFIEKDRCLL